MFDYVSITFIDVADSYSGNDFLLGKSVGIVARICSLNVDDICPVEKGISRVKVLCLRFSFCIQYSN